MISARETSEIIEKERDCQLDWTRIPFLDIFFFFQFASSLPYLGNCNQGSSKAGKSMLRMLTWSIVHLEYV